MFCTNCGKEIKQGSLFCSNCGNTIKSDIEVKVTTEKKENEKFEKNLNPKNRKNILIIICIGIIITILAFVFYLYNNLFTVEDETISVDNSIYDVEDEIISVDNSALEKNNKYDSNSIMKMLTTTDPNTKMTGIMAISEIRLRKELNFLEEGKAYLFQSNYKVYDNTINFYIIIPMENYSYGYDICSYEASYTITDKTIEYFNNYKDLTNSNLNINDIFQINTEDLITYSSGVPLETYSNYLSLAVEKASKILDYDPTGKRQEESKKIVIDDIKVTTATLHINIKNLMANNPIAQEIKKAKTVHLSIYVENSEEEYKDYNYYGGAYEGEETEIPDTITETFTFCKIDDTNIPKGKVIIKLDNTSTMIKETTLYEKEIIFDKTDTYDIGN